MLEAEMVEAIEVARAQELLQVTDRDLATTALLWADDGVVALLRRENSMHFQTLLMEAVPTSRDEEARAFHGGKTDQAVRGRFQGGKSGLGFEDLG